MRPTHEATGEPSVGSRGLNVSVRMIDVLADKGELRPVRIGARELFPWPEILRLAGIEGLEELSK